MSVWMGDAVMLVRSLLMLCIDAVTHLSGLKGLYKTTRREIRVIPYTIKGLHNVRPGRWKER